MKFKVQKHTTGLDADVLAYTQRRIREMRGENPYMLDSQPMHPYIRRRLDEIKAESIKKKNKQSHNEDSDETTRG
tara:strand:+ start:133 stop:357 length:225 start_codon:yes stop_codon:yes gene_type:complete